MGIKELVASAGSGARGAKFADVGTIVGGTVISAEIIQSRDEDGAPEFWDDGKPKQKIRVIVQTELDEGADEQGRPDDGKRALYVKWWSSQKKAFIEALAKAEADDVLPGGIFHAKFKSEGERVKKAWSPTKEMVYRYKAPAVVPDEDFDEPVAAPVPVAKPAAAVKPTPVEDDTVAALDAAGLDDF